MNEEWRPAPSSGGRYEVSSLGRVRNSRIRRPLTGKPSSSGYLQVDMYRPRATPLKLSVHREVCAAFHGPRPFDRAVVRHLDGDKANNRAENLAWGSYADNEADKKAHGTALSGEGCTWRKLDQCSVDEIRRRYAEGGVLQRELAEWFGVSQVAISQIILEKVWRTAS